MLNRTELVQQWLEQLNPEVRPSLDCAMREWWRNIRETGGLGLSDIGYEWLVDVLQLPRWEYRSKTESATALNFKRLLILDRHCPCVYWFKSTSKETVLTFFDSREAMTYQLYGSLDRYLQTLSAG